MKHFKVEYETVYAAQNSRDFVKNHMDAFWDIFKPLIPYIAGLLLFDFLVTHFAMEPDEEGKPKEFALGEMIASYFFTCLVISWHRVVLDGPDRYIPMNPFKPQKSEWAFIGMGLALGFGGGFIAGLFVYGAAATKQALLGFLVIPIVLLVIYLGLKFVFYFPSKATGNSITLKQSFAMTKGYVWKLIAANFRATWRLILIMILFIIGAIITASIIGGIIGASGNTEMLKGAGMAIKVLVMLPITFYFQPLLTVIGVTVLSNYYQHALQNKPAPQE